MQYLSFEIYDTVQKIGNQVRKFEPLLYFDGIKFEDLGQKGKNRKRSYLFQDVHNVHNVQDVHNVHNVQMEMNIEEHIEQGEQVNK